MMENMNLECTCFRFILSRFGAHVSMRHMLYLNVVRLLKVGKYYVTVEDVNGISPNVKMIG